MHGIDTTTDVTDWIPWLQSRGIRCIGRYYSRFPWKVMGPAEALALSRAGLNLFAVYQDRQTEPADFSRAAGRIAAASALEHAVTQIGQPSGSAIYFAVDFDADQADVATHVVPYFEAVNLVIGEAGRGLAVGVYGNGLVCRLLLGAGLVRYSWLGQAADHHEYYAFRDSGRWSIIQGDARSTPFAHDVCDVTDDSAVGYGGFTIA